MRRDTAARLLARIELHHEHLQALSLHQPWASAIFRGKSLENRSWCPSQRVLGSVIAIHAARRDPDPAAIEAVRALATGPLPDPMPRGAVVGLARVERWIPPGAPCESPWRDPHSWSWELSDAHELSRPIHVRGCQGLWALPPAVRRAILAQLEEALA